MEKILSIIIPVYNVEQYLDKCLSSVLNINQREEIEVLAINDGSTDGSLEILKKFQKEYPSVLQVIDKQNGGHGSAWNEGLKLATGKYIKFLDSDDWFSNLDRLIRLLKNLDVDVLFNNLNIYYSVSNTNKLVKIPIEANKVIDADTFGWDSIRFGSDLTNFHYCVYRRNLLQPLYPLFLEKTSFDDGILFVAPLIYCRSIFYSDFEVYNYHIGREGQSMGKGSDVVKKVRQIYNVRMNILHFCHTHSTSSTSKIAKLVKIQNSLVLKLFAILNRLPLEESKEKTVSLYQEYLLLPARGKNFYIRMYEMLPFNVYWFILNSLKKWLK